MFTIFLRDDGRLWAFGWNSDGNLGDGTRDNMVTRPKQIVNGGVAAIPGYLDALFIKRDGSLWGMGKRIRTVGAWYQHRSYPSAR